MLAGTLSYPRPIGRGPIEAMFALPRARPIQTIRARSDAAPLKLSCRDRVDDKPARYPRPIGRGPIEAFGIRPGRMLAYLYPRPIGRGPIEAHELRCGVGRDVLLSAPDRTRPH